MYPLLSVVWGPGRRCQVKTVAGCSSTLAAAPAASSWLPVPGNNAEAHSVTTDPTTVPADHTAATTYAGKCFLGSCTGSCPKTFQRFVIPERDLSVKKERYFPRGTQVVSYLSHWLGGLGSVILWKCSYGGTVILKSFDDVNPDLFLEYFY